MKAKNIFFGGVEGVSVCDFFTSFKTTAAPLQPAGGALETTASKD